MVLNKSICGPYNTMQFFFCCVVDCCLAICSFLLSFSKQFNCRLENGVVLDMGVVAILAVAVVLVVFVAAAMASRALAKLPIALVADCCFLVVIVDLFCGYC